MPLLSGLFHKRTAEDEDDEEEEEQPKLKLFRRRRKQHSDSGHDLVPPPAKSTLFSALNQSVHSLPNHSLDTPHRPSSDVRSDHPLKKSQGLFSWNRERSKSRPPLPPPPTDISFNLKSFRHLRPDSPSPPPPPPPPEQPSNSLLPPRPRPRGDSIASDSSQRISVAAFREAQARSRTNSPVPSFRPSSTPDTIRLDAPSRKRASTVSVVSATDRPSPALPSPVQQVRSDHSVPDSSSDDSDSDDDEDVDSDGEPIPKPSRKRTITRRVNGTPSSPRQIDQQSHTANLSISHHSDQLPSSRKRASVSTSALTPNAAARSASILANSHAQSRLNDVSDESTDSSDTDYEDKPLSDLVPPRRPGSSASNYSNGRIRMPVKPLIDINTLAGGPPLLTPILRHEDSVKNLHNKGKEPEVEKDQPFSIPAVLALSSSPSPPISPSVSKQNPPSVPRPASAAAHLRSSADVSSALAKSKAPDNDDDLINAIRLVSVLDKDDQLSAPSDRIVPTPIRAREPPTSFTVLSRPPHRQSTGDPSPPPSSKTRLAVSSPAPQSDIGPQQRASTMVNSSTQKDKSDTVSIVSGARSSASHSSSRVPPVPLIHSIPDSPSVKEDQKSRSVPRTLAANVSQGRSQPPMPSSNKALSHGSSMPQRPFASNSSIRGESPAGSSTGDSSSGRMPFTPRDGSDIGVRSKDASDADSTLKARGHAKKHSVTFEDQINRGRERAKPDLSNEQRTRERRRSEAKAALELGKIVNGRGPLKNDDSDEDTGLHGRNPKINVTMENGAMMQPGWPAWQQPMATSMPPIVPSQFGSDPAFFAAHQRALLIAKQAYQMAVAQHAMQMAGEEWERSSNAGFGSGGSVYGGGSGGSVYGGGSGASVYSGVGAGMSPMGMMSVPNMGMLMPPNPWAARSSVTFPSAPNSVYGISSSQSEYGGSGGWGSRSVYGDSFGPASSRTSYTGNGAHNSSASVYGGSSRPRASTGAAPPSTSSSRPSAAPGKSRAAPPSSWKCGR